MLDILISYFLFHNFNTGGGVTLMDIQKEQKNLNNLKHL